MIDCGCHDNDTSNALNMAFFVHFPSKPTTTQKITGASKILFPTLLHFLQESLLRRSRLSRLFQLRFRLREVAAYSVREVRNVDF